MTCHSSATSKSARGGPGRAAAAAIAALLLALTVSGAQEAAAPALSVRLDKAKAAIGEPITMTVTAENAAGVEWESRSVADRVGSFDVDQVFGPAPPPPDPNAGAGAARPGVTQWVFRLSAFEFGKQTIPAIPLRYTPAGGGEPRSVSTGEQQVEIVPTVTDPNQEAADVRGGFTLPRDWWPWIYGGLLAALAVLGVWFLARALKRRKPKAQPARPAPPPAPLRPAYDRWLEALEALLRSGLLEKGKVKEFHVEIAEIVKRYLGEVYAFDAVDRTTWEVLQEMSAARIQPAVRSGTAPFLEACDLVKFAKHRPERAEIEATIAGARSLLDLARPVTAAPAPSGARAAAAEGAA